MKTYMANSESVKKRWYLVDAANQPLGRLASELARRLRGKHKPEFTPHADVGDFMVVVNAEQVKVSGAKAADKIYHRHTGFPGGIKSQTFTQLLTRFPDRVIRKAVAGMLPKGPLGRQMLAKLKIYAGGEHPHEAQKPKVLDFNPNKEGSE